MTKTILRAALLATAFGAAAATPVLAQGYGRQPLALTVTPGANPGPGAFRPVVGKRGAEHAANMVGLADIDDTDLDEGVWTVTGTDINDKDMTVLVDARSGRVLRANYD